MPSTCGSRRVSARPVPAQVPGTRASLTPLLGLSEKEARIAKERELGIYKEHKVSAPPTLHTGAPAVPRLWAVLSASCWVVPLEVQDGWGLLGGQRVVPATQGPVSLGRVTGPSQP